MENVITMNFDDIIKYDNEIDWENLNRQYYFTGIHPVHQHTHKKRFIDIDKIPNNFLAEWLQNNGDYICYEESNATIESRHRIPAISTSSNIKFVGISWKDLQIEILKLNIKNYDAYIVIDVDQVNDKLYFTKNQIHDPTKNNFSVPFLKSVVEINKLTDTDFFMFGETRNNDLIFEVKNKMYYYNITDYPFSVKYKN